MGFVGGAGGNAYGGWVGPRRSLLFILLLIIFVNLITCLLSLY